MNTLIDLLGDDYFKSYVKNHQSSIKRQADACREAEREDIKMAEKTRKMIEELLRKTKRPGVEGLIEQMELDGFYTAPCSGAHHLAYEGGLAEHTLNVFHAAEKLNEIFDAGIAEDSIILTTVLHDYGKCGQYGKPNYVPNMLKGRPTKANPNPEPKQSESKPYKTNPDLMYVDHEVRSIVAAQRFIYLTEEEQQAILWHNGMYGTFRYEIQGKEFPLYLILHFADMWASRVIEKEDGDAEI